MSDTIFVQHHKDLPGVLAYVKASGGRNYHIAEDALKAGGRQPYGTTALCGFVPADRPSGRARYLYVYAPVYGRVCPRCHAKARS